MSSPILWTGISVLPYYNYIYLDIINASSKINKISYSGEIRREKLTGNIYSNYDGKDMNFSYIHFPTTMCTCGYGYEGQNKEITGPTLIKPKSSICTCNLVDGTLRIDNVLQDGSHLRNTLSVLLTFRKKNEKETTIIVDFSETCETLGRCIRVSTTEESGIKLDVKHGFAVMFVTNLNDDHEQENGFDGAEYTYPMIVTNYHDYDIDNDFDNLIFTGIENIGNGWDRPAPKLLYATQDSMTTTNVKEGGMRI